jgi:hypothetical protein
MSIQGETSVMKEVGIAKIMKSGNALYSRNKLNDRCTALMAFFLVFFFWFSP